MSQISPLFDEGCCKPFGSPIGACHIPPFFLIRIRQPIAAYHVLLVVELGFCSMFHAHLRLKISPRALRTDTTAVS